MVPKSRPGEITQRNRQGRARRALRRAAGTADRRPGEALGGFLTIEDLKAQKAEWVEPISVPFKGYRVWELPPNNQGIAVLEMLRILESDDLKSLGQNSAPISTG